MHPPIPGTIHLGVQVTPIDDFNIHVYSDTDWGGDITDIVLASGYIQFMDQNLISWSSRKKNIVSRSSTESEYMAVANSLCETVWVTNLINEL